MMRDAPFEDTYRLGRNVRPSLDHWTPFGGMSDERLSDLVGRFAKGGYPVLPATTADPELFLSAVPADEPRGEVRSIGYGYDALLAEQGNELVIRSIYPSTITGASFPFEIDSVDMSEDRLQFRVNGSLHATEAADAESTMLSYFSTDPVWMRHFYRRGDFYRVGLVLLAQACAPAVGKQIEMPTPDWMKRAWADSDIPELRERAEFDTITIDDSELCTIIATDEKDGRPDECYFRGRVNSARKFKRPIADSEGWTLQITVLHWDDAEQIMPVFVTKSAWEGADPPKRGMYVEGGAWVQGRMLEPLRPSSGI